MDTAYGNRIPPVYRRAVGALVLVPLSFMVWAAAAGLIDLTPTVFFTLLGVGLVFVYSRAGTTVSADEETVRHQDIATVAVEPVTLLSREWGNRGFLRRDGEIFVDAGQSTDCLAFHLADGTVIRLGMSSPEHTHAIAAALPLEARS